MHPEAVNGPTKRVLAAIAAKLGGDFYLAGGTALAIQLGHRKSLDLDFFSEKDFSRPALKKTLGDIGDFELTGEDDGTLHGVLDGVRVSFLRYAYPVLFPLVGAMDARLADERDIAAMKLDAISSRGSKKDFVDLYFLAQKYPLAELLKIFKKKYAAIKFNTLHLLKSLAYFEDAEDEPMPIMLKPVAWDAVKNKITADANSIVTL